MEAKGITKSDFRDALNDNKMFTTLRLIRDWTYEQFKEDLKPYIADIKDALQQTSNKIDGLSDDELIDKFLNVVVRSFIHFQSQALFQMIQDPSNMAQLLHQMTGRNTASSKDTEDFSKQLKKLERFMNDHDKYFQYSEKLFHTLATQAIKKTAKIYDLLPDSNISEVNIVNPELWYKLYGYKSKLSKEYREFNL